MVKKIIPLLIMVSLPAYAQGFGYTYAWDYPADELQYVERFELEYSFDGESWGSVAIDDVSALTADVLVPDTITDGTITARAKACNSRGCSGYSNIVSTDIPPILRAPANLKIMISIDIELP